MAGGCGEWAGVEVDLQNGTLSFGVNGGQLHRMPGVELPARLRPWVMFAGDTAGAAASPSG